MIQLARASRRSCSDTSASISNSPSALRTRGPTGSPGCSGSPRCKTCVASGLRNTPAKTASCFASSARSARSAASRSRSARKDSAPCAGSPRSNAATGSQGDPWGIRSRELATVIQFPGSRATSIRYSSASRSLNFPFRSRPHTIRSITAGSANSIWTQPAPFSFEIQLRALPNLPSLMCASRCWPSPG